MGAHPEHLLEETQGTKAPDITQIKVDQDTQGTDIQTLDVTVLQEGDQIMVMAEPDGSDSGGTARAITRGGGDMAFPMVGRRIG